MKSWLLGACAVGAIAASGMAHAQAPLYRQVAAVPLGSPDRWDYVVVDGAGDRVYVAHDQRLDVIDAHSLKRIGEVSGITGGAHGTYTSVPNGLGFTDDGKAGKAIAFDLKTLKVRATLDAAPDADAVAGDANGVYVMNGDTGTITVIDPKGPAVAATIQVGGSLEYAVADGAGHLFVNGAERGEIVRIDTASRQITARWPVADCKSPHGLAIDVAHHRLFTSCVNARMDVVDSETGREVTSVPIGLGTDSAAFDPVRHRVFSSNGKDGTISVIQQIDANTYRPLEPVRTAIGARTMAADPATGRLFVASAVVDPSGPTTGRRRFVPGTLKLLVLNPTP